MTEIVFFIDTFHSNPWKHKILLGQQWTMLIIQIHIYDKWFLYLFVLVERIDDEFHHTIHLCLEYMFLGFISQFVHLGYTETI